MIFDILLEFVECVVHQVLYMRSVYPECDSLPHVDMTSVTMYRYI